MGQADRQTEGTGRAESLVLTCTAPPISLRVNLLAETARETRFHARGCSVVVKRMDAVVDVDVKKSVPNMHAEEEQFHAESRPPCLRLSVQ
jgi:hypothetical protein